MNMPDKKHIAIIAVITIVITLLISPIFTENPETVTYYYDHVQIGDTSKEIPVAKAGTNTISLLEHTDQCIGCGCTSLYEISYTTPPKGKFDLKLYDKKGTAKEAFLPNGKINKHIKGNSFDLKNLKVELCENVSYKVRTTPKTWKTIHKYYEKNK